MRYILAYFALMLALSGFSLLIVGRVEGFGLILIAGILVYVLVRMAQARRRERRYGGYDAAIDGYERRLATGERNSRACTSRTKRALSGCPANLPSATRSSTTGSTSCLQT